MTDRKLPTPPSTTSKGSPLPGRTGVGNAEATKSFTTNNVPNKIGKPKPGGG
ncbi:hypothetical protein [Rhizobium sp. AC44/96]|uniref:hypothetical protein n=1 Tax=Rhizobium sp. AC44/96 TaxID=1841654 RepID=UPI001300D3E3|nr:hypothetical protein [Rhizobium sp. AC44/96]